jgi:hypothetical protein
MFMFGDIPALNLRVIRWLSHPKMHEYFEGILVRRIDDPHPCCGDATWVLVQKPLGAIR